MSLSVHQLSELHALLDKVQIASEMKAEEYQTMAEVYISSLCLLL